MCHQMHDGANPRLRPRLGLEPSDRLERMRGTNYGASTRGTFQTVTAAVVSRYFKSVLV